jgi:hypothetical protein
VGTPYFKVLASLAVLATVAGGAAATEADTRDGSGGHTAASAGHKRCATSGREIRAASRLVVVTYYRKVTTTAGGRTDEAFTFACWRATGRERRIEIEGDDVVLAGAWVGYRAERGFNHNNETIATSVATNVRTGQDRDIDGVVNDVVADDMVLKPNGSFAILGRERQQTNTAVVAALDRDGGRTLSTSPEIVQGSLVLNGGHVSWREGAVRRSARLR